MADSLVVKLGADTSDFKGGIHEAAESTREMGGALDEVGKSLEHFNENTNRIQHHLLNNFLGFEAINHIREWAAEAIKGAQETREQFEKLGKPIDDATRSLAGFGDNLESIKHGAVDLAGSFLSFFTRAGEGWGMLINRLRGVSAEQEKIGEEAARGAAEQAKKLAEVAKAHADDGKKAAEIETKIDEDKYKRGLALMTQAGQINELTKKKTELEEQLASITGKSDQDRLRAAQKKLEIDQVSADLDSKMAKKRADDANAETEFLKEQVTLDEKLKKAKFDLLKPADQLVDLQNQLLAVTNKVNDSHLDQESHKKALIDQATIQKEIADKTLEIEKQTTEEIKKQAKAKQASNNFDSGILKISSGFQTYNDPGEQAEYEKGLVNQAKAEIGYEIADLQSKLDEYQKSGSSLGAYEIPAIRARIQALQGRSQNVQDFVFNPNYQDAAGKGIFASQVSTIGDPLGLQKKQTDTTTKVAQGIDDINNRLRSAGFGINGG